MHYYILEVIFTYAPNCAYQRYKPLTIFFLEPGYKKILKELYESHRFEFNTYKSSTLVKGIKNRMNRLGYNCEESYLDANRSNKNEKEKPPDNFITNIGHFFRVPLAFGDPDKFEILEFFNNKYSNKLVQINSSCKIFRRINE